MFSGRLAVETDLRVMEVNVDVPASGWEDVTLTLGISRPDPRSVLSANLVRLGQLERR